MKTVDVVFAMTEAGDMKFLELQVDGNPIDIGVWDLSEAGHATVRLPLEQLSELVTARSEIASKQSNIESLERSIASQQAVIDHLRSAPPEPVPAPEVTPQYLLFELAKLITKV